MVPAKSGPAAAKAAIEASKSSSKKTAKKSSKKKTASKSSSKSSAKVEAEKRRKEIQKAKATIYKHTKKKPAKEHKGGLPYVPSGSLVIDDLIGGTLLDDGKTQKCPGYPRQKVIEVFGPEGSGKTTLALEAIAEVQRNGGWAMLLDYEHVLDHDYARSIGVSFDDDKLLYFEPETIEEGFKFIYVGVGYGVDLVVVDSIAAMVSEKEMGKDVGKTAQIGVRAKAMSEFLPKAQIWITTPKVKIGNSTKGYYTNERGGPSIMFINQTRMNITTSGKGAGGLETTPGGRALKFFAALRLRASRIKTETRKEKDKFSGEERNVPFGALTQVKVVKSKIDRKTGASSNVFIRYGHGIDDIYSVIESGIFTKVIKKETGGYYTLPDPNIPRIRGRENLVDFLKSNQKALKDLHKIVMSAVHAKFYEAEEADEEVDDQDLFDQVMETEFGEGEGDEEGDMDIELD